jgi:hypothetical protein
MILASRLKRINGLLPSPKKAPVFELPQVPRVHFRQFAQVPLAHGPLVVDGPLQPSSPHALLISLDAVEDLFAAGIEGLWCHRLQGEVFLCHGFWRARLLPPIMTLSGGRTRRRQHARSAGRRRRRRVRSASRRQQHLEHSLIALGLCLFYVHVHMLAQQLCSTVLFALCTLSRCQFPPPQEDLHSNI